MAKYKNAFFVVNMAFKIKINKLGEEEKNMSEVEGRRVSILLTQSGVGIGRICNNSSCLEI